MPDKLVDKDERWAWREPEFFFRFERIRSTTPCAARPKTRAKLREGGAETTAPLVGPNPPQLNNNNQLDSEHEANLHPLRWNLAGWVSPA